MAGWNLEARSASDAILNEVRNAAGGIIASRYMSYAFFALLIYDHILTITDEITIVWLGRRSLVKVLFLLNRYIVPLLIAIDVATLSGYMPLTRSFCHSWVQAEVVLEMMSLLTTTLIITFRIHAILGNMRGLLPVLLSLWGAQAVVSAVLVIMLVNIKAGPTITVQPIFNVCFAILDRVYTIWIPSMFFHTLVFILLVWKALSTPRDAQTPLLMLLLRDGMVFYGVVFLAMLFNLIVWAVAPITLALLPHDAVWAVCTMALSRLMLSVNNLPTSAPPSGEGEMESKSRPISMTAIPPRRTLELPSQAALQHFGSNALESGTLVMSNAGTPRDEIFGYKRGNSISSSTDHGHKQSDKRMPFPMAGTPDPEANPEWYPGAISDAASQRAPTPSQRAHTPSQRTPTPTSRRTFSISRAVTPTSPPPKLSLDSASPLPFVRPLPHIPPPRREPKGVPEDVKPPRPQPRSRAASDDALRFENVADLITLPNKKSRRSSVIRGLRAISPRDDGKSRKSDDSGHSPELLRPVRLLPTVPSASAPAGGAMSGTSVPQLLYRLPSQREILDRNGGLRMSVSGGVEF